MNNSNFFPAISKRDFAAHLNYLRTTRERFEKLCEAMEELSPGFRVDFFPNLGFETRMVDLLNMLMHEDPEDSLIDYFLYELDFGFNSDDGTPGKIKLLTEECEDKTYDISTPEKLYDALVDINFTYHISMQPKEKDKEEYKGEPDAHE